MTEATWALVGVTGLLAVLAGWYAHETRRIVDRMDKDREASSRAWIVFGVIPLRANWVKVRIQNLGPGPAIGICGQIEAKWNDGPYSIAWSYPMLAPGKYEEFPFPGPPGTPRGDRSRLDVLRTSVHSVDASLAWRSASGRDYSLDETVDVAQLTEDWVNSEMQATEDHPERLMPRIAKALDDIAERLKSREGS